MLPDVKLSSLENIIVIQENWCDSKTDKPLYCELPELKKRNIEVGYPLTEFIYFKAKSTTGMLATLEAPSNSTTGVITILEAPHKLN